MTTALQHFFENLQQQEERTIFRKIPPFYINAIHYKRFPHKDTQALNRSKLLAKYALFLVKKGSIHRFSLTRTEQLWEQEQVLTRML